MRSNNQAIRAILTALSLSVAGCSSTFYAAEDKAACESQGAKPGSEPFATCLRNLEIARHNESHGHR